MDWIVAAYFGIGLGVATWIRLKEGKEAIGWFLARVLVWPLILIINIEL